MRPRLTRFDELLAQEHHWLRGDELCYFLREYTPGVGYAGSETNSLINNLKKPPAVRDTPQWYWKGQAVQQVARELRGALPDPWLARTTLVPMPPSKTEDHPESAAPREGMVNPWRNWSARSSASRTNRSCMMPMVAMSASAHPASTSAWVKTPGSARNMFNAPMTSSRRRIGKP